MTAEPELWFDDELLFDEEVEPVDEDPLEVEPLDEDESSLPDEDELSLPDEEESSLLEDVVPELVELPVEVVLAVVAVSDWPEVLGVEPVVAVLPVLPSEPVAAIVPKASAKVDSAAAMTRRRMIEIRRARARSRSRTRSSFEVGGGVEGMRPS